MLEAFSSIVQNDPGPLILNFDETSFIFVKIVPQTVGSMSSLVSSLLPLGSQRLTWSWS